MTTKVLSVGGSIIAPDKVDTDFLRDFTSMISSLLLQEQDLRLILVCGGGAPARIYQNAFISVAGSKSANDAADWIGIMATRLNAQLLKACFAELCTDPVVTNPTAKINFSGRILIASGWKPGFSTDNDAVLLAKKFDAKTILNLSNIAKVFTDDPKKNPNAKPLDKISWADFKKIVGTEWTPGKNCPFDPIATKLATKLNLSVICADGKNIKNTRAILTEKNYTGTLICN